MAASDTESIPVLGFSHIRLTVTDIDLSRAFYDAVFGWHVYAELPPDADEEVEKELWFLFGGVIYDIGGGRLLGLRPVSRDRFDEDRTGLDHLSFAVAGRGVLEDAIATLDRVGAPHDEIKDIGFAHILEFRDPDGIALELTAPKA